MSSRASTRFALLLVLFAALGLSRSVSTSRAQTTPASPYPMQVVAMHGDGPALFLSAAQGAPAVGYLSDRVPLELVEAPHDGRALVRIRGGMRVRAYIDASRIGAVVQRRGRVRGTPTYVGGGDVVRFDGFDTDGRARITVHVEFASMRWSKDYSGTFPAAGLGASTPPVGAETTPPGTPGIIRATSPLRVFDQAGGTLLETLPIGSVNCRLMAPAGSGYTVLLGTGPYLAGYVAEEPAPSLAVGAAVAGTDPNPVPARLRSQENFPLVRLAAGTRVMFAEQVLAILDQPGFARVLARHDGTGEADVFVAVGSDLAVRGMVPLTALGAEID